MQDDIMKRISPEVLNKKMSDLDESDIINGFIAMAMIGAETKESIQTKRDELEEKVDALTKEAEIVNKDIDRWKRANADQKSRFEKEYGSAPEAEKKREDIIKTIDKYQKFIQQLESALEDYKNFNKERFFANVRYELSENPDIKVGQIEREANLRLGYTARLEKPDNTAEPSIEYVCSAAKMLGVSIDVLTSIDLQALTPTEKKLCSFVEKLKKDTADDKLNWSVETANELNRPECDINGNTDHPLLALETFMEEGETEYPEEVTRITFNSHSFGPNTCIAGDCFNLKLKNSSYLYIMNISKSVHIIGDPSAYAKEVWMYAPRSGRQFLMASNDGSALAQLVNPLYEIVRERSKHPKLKEEFSSAIDAFMNDDMEDDREPFPFTDDTLPFN